MERMKMQETNLDVLPNGICPERRVGATRKCLSLGGVAFVEVVEIHRRGSGAWNVQARSTFARVGSPPSGNGWGPSASDSETFGKHEGCEKLNHERLEGEDPEELASKRSLEMEPDRERLSFGCKGQLLDSSPRNRRVPELLRPTSRDRDAR